MAMPSPIWCAIPTLSDLVGGVQAVTLGDDEARRRGSQKGRAGKGLLSPRSLWRLRCTAAAAGWSMAM